MNADYSSRTASAYAWRPGYRGGRDDGNNLYYANGVEMDATAGGPLMEDPHAYWAARKERRTNRARRRMGAWRWPGGCGA
jgi:hypothetical protein